jgi:hypothetical protein
MTNNNDLPRFFRLRQKFERPRVDDIEGRVQDELRRVCRQNLQNQSVAITAGSRGIANIARITRACVDFCHEHQAKPFIVPAMGSHGGATAEGQREVLKTLGITEETMGCPIRSSMEVDQICQAAEGFPVFFDRNALNADLVLVVNRIKPHTRFAGDIESGLMKMMLIGLGKQKGAEVYHRVIQNYSFDRIVRSVAKEVINRCGVLAGLAVLENAYEETADLQGVTPHEIETREAELLRSVKGWMPKLPFDKADLLIIDRIGKNISGTGMDTNVIGRKFNDHAAIDGDAPSIHHIYVRGLTPETHGNASGIGLAELCHRRVIEDLDVHATRMNCITAGHITGAMLPVDFESDMKAITTACQMSGYKVAEDIQAMWIPDTLHLEQVACSEGFYSDAKERGFEILESPRPLQFDASGDLEAWF